jgi:hypothetical protein
MLIGFAQVLAKKKSSHAERFRPGTGLWAILSGEARCLSPRPQAFAVKKRSAAMKK